ncbi:MarR family transcriptional regulator [Nocardia sp. NPDC005998]|uniref:MarR family winged helix-turn-helix transcriptional regulator n=1 Tax=Nocardia sp. NPDC005998 TaxID=3156894 RepID=UPI0033A5D97F
MSPSLSPSRPSVLLTLPVFAISRLGRIANEKVRAVFSQEGLSWRGHFILVCLKEHGELSQRELADLASLDPSDLVKVLDVLEDTGLVQRRPDPRDRRRHVLSITDDGQDVCLRGEELIRTVTTDLLAPLGADRQAALHELVTTIIDAHTTIDGDRRPRPGWRRTTHEE